MWGTHCCSVLQCVVVCCSAFSVLQRMKKFKERECEEHNFPANTHTYTRIHTLCLAHNTRYSSSTYSKKKGSFVSPRLIAPLCLLFPSLICLPPAPLPPLFFLQRLNGVGFEWDGKKIGNSNAGKCKVAVCLFVQYVCTCKIRALMILCMYVFVV